MAVAEEIELSDQPRSKACNEASSRQGAPGAGATAAQEAQQQATRTRVAKEAVASVLRRAKYEGLKVLVWRFPRGTHVVAGKSGGLVCPGDILEHHAIYISAEEVIHMEPDRGVVSDTWVEFLRKFPRWRTLHRPLSAEHSEEVVRRARSKARVPMSRPYSPLLHNCEHFARWCYDGEERSDQARQFAGTAFGTGVAGAGLLPVLGVPLVGLGLSAGAPTVIFGVVFGVGMVLGAAAGVALAPAAWMMLRQQDRRGGAGATADGGGPCKLPVGVVNEVEHGTFRLRLCGTIAGPGSRALARPNALAELDPTEIKEEFTLRVFNHTEGGEASCVLLQAQVQRGAIYRLVMANNDDGGDDAPRSSSHSSSVPERLKRNDLSTPLQRSKNHPQLALLHASPALLPAYGPE